MIDSNKWESLGFPSKSNAEAFICIADVNTSTHVRRQTMREMADRVRDNANRRRKTRERAEAPTVATGVPGTARAPAQGSSYYGQTNRHPPQQYQPLPPQPATQLVPYQGSNGTQVLTYVPAQGQYGTPQLPPTPGPYPPPPGQYLAFPIVATGIATRRIPKELHVSETLPHIRIPLGDVDHGISLLVLYDTGGGLSIGRRAYHEQIRQLRPDLVTQFIDLNDDNRYDPLTIGGIDGEVYGPSVTAIISYRLPYIVNGHNCSITFGLAEQAVTNSLVGLPFMIMAGMVHSAKDRMVSSTVFASSYVCEHLQPVQTDAPGRLMENDTSRHWWSGRNHSQSWLATEERLLPMGQTQACPAETRWHAHIGRH
jgi:hypothetical protein